MLFSLSKEDKIKLMIYSLLSLFCSASIDIVILAIRFAHLWHNALIHMLKLLTTQQTFAVMWFLWDQLTHKKMCGYCNSGITELISNFRLVCGIHFQIELFSLCWQLVSKRSKTLLSPQFGIQWQTTALFFSTKTIYPVLVNKILRFLFMKKLRK